MPITRALTDEELQGLENQGIDSSLYKGKPLTLATDDELASQQAPVRQSMSSLGAAKATAEAHAGGYIGGGAAALGTGALIGEVLGAPETLGASLLAIPPTLAAAYGGSYLGQKAQNAIQGQDTTANLQAQAEQAEAEHPYISSGTDIAASALLSGGKPSLSNIPKALMGDRDAIAKVAMNGLVNPAINSGLQYATTGQAPSLSDIGSQIAGGALFSEANALGRMVHGGEPVGEPTAKTEVTGENPGPDEVKAALSPFLQTDPEHEDYISDKNIKDAYIKSLGKRPAVTDLNDPAQYIAKTKYDNALKMPVDDIRQMLHERWANTTPTEEPTVALPKEGDSEATQRVIPTANDNAQNIEKPVVQPETQTTNEKADEAANKASDFEKARAQLVSQQYQDTDNPLKPITENQAKIINPATLLGNNLDRPNTPQVDSEGNPVHYSPKEVYSDEDINRLNIINQLKQQAINSGNSIPEHLINEAQAIHKKYEVQNLDNRDIKLLSIAFEHANNGFPVDSILNVLGRNSNKPEMLKAINKARGISNPVEAVHTVAKNLGLTPIEKLGDVVKYNPIIHEDTVSGMIPNDSAKVIQSGYKNPYGYDDIRAKVEPSNINSPKDINEDSNIEDQATKALFQRPTDTSGPTQDMQKYSALKDIFLQHIRNNDFPRAKMVQEQLEALKNKYGGMPPFKTGTAPVSGQTIEQHVKAGGATTGSVLGMIAAKQNEWSPLAKQMLETASPEKLKDQVLSHSGKETSFYNTNRNLASIHQNHLNDNGVIMHELSHSVLEGQFPQEFNDLAGKALQDAQDKYLADPKANSTIKELINLHREVLDKLGIDRNSNTIGNPNKNRELYKGSVGDNSAYAVGSFHEFTAMSQTDPKFQKTLNELKSSDGKTLWSKFVDAVRKLLGVDVKSGSLLERALKVNEDLIKQPRKGYETDEEGNRYYESPDKTKPYYTGVVDSNDSVRAIEHDRTKAGNSHSSLGMPDRTGRWRYIPNHNRVDWTDTPSESRMDAVDNFLAKKGIYPDSHKAYIGPQIYRESDSNIHESPKKIGDKEERTEEPPIHRMGAIGRVFRSGIDTIKSLAHPDAEHTAGQLQKVFQEREAIMGRQGNPVIEKAKGISPEGEARLNAAKRYELENHQDAPLSMFKNSKELSAWQAYKKSLETNFNERLANKEPVVANGVARLPIRDPNYHPTTSNPKVAEVLRANTDPKAIAELNKQWNDYYTTKLGKSPSQAQDAFNRYRRALQGNAMNSGSSGNQAFFNAARRPQGEPLPPSFERPGFFRNFEAYIQAQAMDNAYYKHVESDPRTMAALGYQHDPWGRPVKQSEDGPISGNTAVKNVLNEIKGEANTGLQGQVIAKSESLATAGLLGPLTEFHKLASNFAKQLSNYADNPIQAGRALAYGATHIAEGWTHAKENGKIVMTAKSASDMWNSQLTAADRLAGVARGVRQIYTLNDLTDKVNLGFLQASGEYLVPYKIQAARDGDASAIRLMRHLDPDWSSSKQYDAKGISTLASQLAGVVHGTRDARTLPSWMLHDNEISAFFKLSSWGIAQTNSFMRDVYTPAREGNLKPLLMSAFGAAVGGYLIKELRQDIAGKKSQIPSLAEIGASDRGYKGNIPALAYNMMAAASYAGFGGMLSTIGRYPFDMAFKNSPQGATFPLDTMVSDIASTVNNVGQTIANDPNIDWLNLASHVGGHLLGGSFQLGRIAMNHAIDSGAITGTIAEKKALSDKLGQLRRFDEVEGLPYQEMDASTSNPYMNLEQKDFKSAQDIGKAMQMLPGLVSNIVQKYGSTPDVMLSKLKALKENSYATFPDLQTMPLSFMKYIGYLNREEGPEAAQSELQDYMKHKIVNEAKASVVP